MDRERAMPILNALAPCGKTGEGDVKRPQSSNHFRLLVGDYRVRFEAAGGGAPRIAQGKHRREAYRRRAGGGHFARPTVPCRNPVTRPRNPPTRPPSTTSPRPPAIPLVPSATLPPESKSCHAPRTSRTPLARLRTREIPAHSLTPPLRGKHAPASRTCVTPQPLENAHFLAFPRPS